SLLSVEAKKRQKPSAAGQARNIVAAHPAGIETNPGSPPSRPGQDDRSVTVQDALSGIAERGDQPCDGWVGERLREIDRSVAACRLWSWLVNPAHAVGGPYAVLTDFEA